MLTKMRGRLAVCALVVLALALSVGAPAMEVRGGLVRFGISETIPAPFNAVSPAQFVVEGDYRYYLPTPFYAPPYAAYFGQVKPPAGPPADFLKVFGPRPVGLSEETDWVQQLGFWAGLGRPDSVSDADAALADLVFAHYGMGALVAYKLNVKGAIVYQVQFPEADKRAATAYHGVVHPAELVYSPAAMEYVVAAYQATLKEQGVAVAELVPILSNDRLKHGDK